MDQDKLEICFEHPWDRQDVATDQDGFEKLRREIVRRGEVALLAYREFTQLVDLVDQTIAQWSGKAISPRDKYRLEQLLWVFRDEVKDPVLRPVAERAKREREDIWEGPSGVEPAASQEEDVWVSSYKPSPGLRVAVTEDGIRRVAEDK